MKPLEKKDLTTHTTPPRNYVLYILMRNDLPSLNPGKAMAQAAHASNKFVDKYGKRQEVKSWQEELGFGTTIVLSASGEQIYRLVMDTNITSAAPRGLIYDPTYPFIVDKEISGLLDPNKIVDKLFRDDGRVVCFREELTCGYIFLVKDSSEQLKLVGDFPLHP